MLATSLLAAAAMLITSSNAAVLTRNKHVADFRLYGDTGCFNKNLGVWTVIDDDILGDPCTGFDDHVESVRLSDINEGCELYVYTDRACKTGRHKVTPGQCSNEPNAWKAWSMKCASK